MLYTLCRRQRHRDPEVQARCQDGMGRVNPDPGGLPVSGAAQPLTWLKRLSVDWRHPAWHLPKCRHPKHRPMYDGLSGTGPIGLEDRCGYLKPCVQPGATTLGYRAVCRWENRVRTVPAVDPAASGGSAQPPASDAVTMCPMRTNRARSPHRGANGPGTMQRDQNSTSECSTSRYSGRLVGICFASPGQLRAALHPCSRTIAPKWSASTSRPNPGVSGRRIHPSLTV